MDKFAALSDPTRRGIVELLAREGPLPAARIVEQFQVSAPAISQHLKILREAGWVQMERRAQQRIYQVDPEAVQEVGQWATRLEQLWSQRFDALEQLIEIEKKRQQD
jgi:DNA-binding transcriptional ArsR family regulator